MQLPQLVNQGQQSGQASSARPSNPTGVPATLPQTTNRLQPGQAMSASGVPFYSSNGEPRNLPRLRVEQPNLPGNNLMRPKNAQDEGATNNILEGVNSGDSVQQPATQQPATQQPAARQPASPMPREGMSSVMAPRSEQESAVLPGEAFTDPRMIPRESTDPRMIPRESTDPRMIPRGSMDAAGAPTYFDMGQGQGAFTAGCQDCVAAGGAANCPTCNPNENYAMGGSAVDGTSGYFGAISRARRYAELDLLYLTRTDGAIVFSNFGGLGSFEPNAAWRFTFGQRSDETQGREFSYFGTSDLSVEANRVDPAGRLDALFQPVGVIDSSLTAPFFNANIQNERAETRVHSIEFNRVRWAWDVVKSFVGFRVIHVQDSYSMFSQRGVNTGDFEIESYNNLVGVHIGREAFYDIGYRISFSGLAKAGLYANANQFDINVANNGVTFLNNETTSSTFSTSLELMLTGHYQINRRARLRMGYQAMLLDQVYSISDNLRGTLSPFDGSGGVDKDSMFFHGINIGLELYR